MTRRMALFGPNTTPGTKLALAAGMLAGNMLLLPLLAQSTAPVPATAAGATAPPPGAGCGSCRGWHDADSSCDARSGSGRETRGSVDIVIGSFYA